MIVQRYDDLEREVRSLHEADGRAADGRLDLFGRPRAHERLLREFLGAHPQADVRLEYLHPHRVYEAVDRARPTWVW